MKTNKKKNEAKPRTKWLVGTAVCIIALFIFTTVKLKHVNVPAELIGTWKTNSPQYADRSLEIGSVSISFTTGGGTQYTGFINDIQKATDKNGMFYTIYYSVNGTRNQMSFYYGTADGGSIQFRNQLDIVWKKEAAI